MPRPETPAGPRKARGIFATVAAIAAALVLTACGARIDTTMNVSEAGAGQRVMVLTLAGSDMSKIEGGPGAADASIRHRLPGSLSYSGLQPTGDGGETATFTLPFSSTSDYQAKAEALLHAGGSIQSAPEFTVSDSTLVHGIALHEDYTSADLLKWMFDGLVTDGVVSSSDSSNMYQLGSGSISFGGKTTKQSDQFDLTDVQDNGFDTVSMQTAIQDPTHITRTVTYTVSSSRYASQHDLLAKFVADSAPSGATVATPSTGTWTVAFSGDPAAIAADTSKALGGSAAFSLAQSDKPGDPSEKVLTLTDNASCAAVCSTTTGSIEDNVSAASGYTPASTTVDTSAQSSKTFTLAPPIKSVAAAFRFEIDGSVSSDVDFVIPKASIDAVGDGFAKRLAPDGSTGTLKTSQGSSEITYTVTIRGTSPTDFAAKYSKWAPGASVTTADQGGNLFLHDTGYSVTPALQGVIGDHQVTNGATSAVFLPLGQWVAGAPSSARQAVALDGASVTVDGLGSALVVRSTGPTVGGLISAAVLLVVFIALVLILVRRRREVLEHLRSVRGRAAVALAEQRLLRFDRTAAPGTEASPRVGSLIRMLPDAGRPLVRQPLLDLRAPVPPPHQASANLISSPIRNPTGSRRGTLFDIDDGPRAQTRPPLLI